MDGKTKAAFERPDVVLEEVGVFVEIDCFEGEFAQAFATVSVGGGSGGDAAAAEFRTGAVLVVHCGVCRSMDGGIVGEVVTGRCLAGRQKVRRCALDSLKVQSNLKSRQAALLEATTTTTTSTTLAITTCSITPSHLPMTFHLGQRLSYAGERCTVRYIGDVAGTKGDWLGVEWDDASRGKHAGIHSGVRYFECKI